MLSCLGETVMTNIRKIILILCVLFLQSQTLNSSNNHRRLIAIADVINEDYSQAKKFFNDSVALPGPDATILRNALQDENTPIITSKVIFDTCYNFYAFSHAMIEKDLNYLEKKYGKLITSNKKETTKNLYTITHFLFKQYKETKEHITTLIESGEKNKRTIMNKTLFYLAKNKLSPADFDTLLKTVHLSNECVLLAQEIINYYHAFSAEKWDVYLTRNGNYVLFPKSYPTDTFSKKYLYLKHMKEEPIIIPESEDIIMMMGYEGRLFVYDLEQLINDIPFEQRKPLDLFMVGHGGLPNETASLSAGLLGDDFQRLIAVLGNGNTHSFFYLTCHGGGITAKKIWFSNKNLKNSSDAQFQAPFITIVSPATELPFNITSPFWIYAWYVAINTTSLTPWFIQKNMRSYVPLPDLKNFFSLITSSIPKALDGSLYRPLKLLYYNEPSITVSQLALIKFPGTDWFSPQFLLEKVLDITKTKSATATFENKSIEQDPSKKIIALSTPIVYAPLIIHQTEDLRILPLLSQDSSYQNSANHQTTYLKKLIIKDSVYPTAIGILKNLSSTNIGPCTVIPFANAAEKKMVQIKKDFFIDEIEGPHGNIIAKKFSITSDGTFFTDTNNQLIHFKPNTFQQTNDISKKLESSFDTVYASAKKTFEKDSNGNNNQEASQTVAQKIQAMKSIENVLANKLLKIRSTN